MGVFVHYAMMNVVNALSSLEMVSRNIPQAGMMTTETRVAADKLAGCVLILEAHMMDLWREKDVEFEKAQVRYHKAIRAGLPVLPLIEEASQFYHAIIELLSRRGKLRFKPPRSFGRKHDE